MPPHKKYKSADIQRLYKNAYSEKFDWNAILSKNTKDFLEVLRRGASCPTELAYTAMLTLAASLAGPKAKVKTHTHANPSPLNLYAIGVCAPGGGKSSTFDNIIHEGCASYNTENAKSLLVESYTHAGLQEHLIATEGFGLIASEEGSRVLSSIEGKQVKYEGERAFLCKSWGGKGDSMKLREKDRGYPATSLCLLLLIQPQPFFKELGPLDGEDGFLDRIVVVIAEAKRFHSHEVQTNAKELALKYKDFVIKLFAGIHNLHKVGPVIYKFTSQAQNLYNDMCDDDVDDFNNQYLSGKFQHVFTIYNRQCTVEDNGNKFTNSVVLKNMYTLHRSQFNVH